MLEEKEVTKYLLSLSETVNMVIKETIGKEITEQQNWLCFYLQEWAYAQEKNLIIEQFRGLGKSLITSIFVMWILLRNRDLKILVISGSNTKAKNFVRYCYMLMKKIPLFSLLLQKGRAGERTSLNEFDVAGATITQDPSVRSIGIEGTITSARANVIIVDDAETKINSRTEAGRQFILETTTEFEALLTAGAKQFIVYLGTRHHRDSLYHHIREERGYKHLITPVYYPKNQKDLEDYKGLLSPHLYEALKKDRSLFGKPTDSRFNEDEIRKKMQGMGKTAFAMQMLLRVEDENTFRPLTLDDVLITNFKPRTVIRGIDISGRELIDEVIRGALGEVYHWYRDVGLAKKSHLTIMAIDPAGKGDDLFTWSIVSGMYGRFYAHDVNGNRNGYKEENLKFILLEARKFGVRQIYIEDNFGDEILIALLKKVSSELRLSFSFIGFKSTANKEMRIIDTLEPIFNQHKIIFEERVICSSNRISEEYGEEYSLIYQMLNARRETKQDHDDCIDCLTMAIDKLKGLLPIISKKSEERQRINDIVDFQTSKINVLKAGKLN